MWVTHSCPTLCDPMDCSPPGSSVHRILQARILEWVDISFSRGASQARDQTRFSHTAGRLHPLSHHGSPSYLKVWRGLRCMCLAQDSQWMVQALSSHLCSWLCISGAALVAQMVKNLPAVRETCVRSLGQKDPLKKGMTTHCSIFAWRIPWTEATVHGITKSWTWLSN